MGNLGLPSVPYPQPGPKHWGLWVEAIPLSKMVVNHASLKRWGLGCWVPAWKLEWKEVACLFHV